WLLPVGDDYERACPAAATSHSVRCGYRHICNECVPLRHVLSHPSGDPSGRRPDEVGEGKMSENGISDVNRREFLAIAAAAPGAFILGFWVPQQANAQAGPRPAWYEDSKTPEINAWIVISPDDTVTIRIGQTELGQGVWT